MLLVLRGVIANVVGELVVSRLAGGRINFTKYPSCRKIWVSGVYCHENYLLFYLLSSKAYPKFLSLVMASSQLAVGKLVSGMSQYLGARKFLKNFDHILVKESGTYWIAIRSQWAYLYAIIDNKCRFVLVVCLFVFLSAIRAGANSVARWLHASSISRPSLKSLILKSFKKRPKHTNTF